MKEWLSGLVGEGMANIVGFILIFAIILGGIFVVLSIIRRFSGGTFSSNSRSGRQPRLSVMDAAAVDSRRKLVLIRRDDVEHLLLIGGPSDVVVEQNIVMESRTNPRSQPSRIDPEHIERFRQHEAGITSDETDRPALSQPVEPQVEKQEPIQLNSAIEPLLERKAEPIRETPSQHIKQETPQFRTPPRAPVTPPAPVVTTSARSQTPRPAPNYPPQPRTVLPAAHSAEQSNTQRLHPAYPLSQVSRGVLNSTSGTGSNVTAAAATLAGSSLGNVTPVADAPTNIKAKTPETSTAMPSPPVMPVSAPDLSASKKPEPAVAITPDDDLGDIGGALHDAIMADLRSDNTAAENAQDPGILEVDIFEEELLGSLDISPSDGESDSSIEDEMEKLLGELTRDEARKL
ncbi:flagellar biosynthetic protein FliO [Brucella gallinifaecis]|uniref:Basic proline-rich protein n=1 Tax=Brucella gallinifaecis TaxID=215590 RepID=A0A502BRN1_9HYPH|nr:flagellar biosynthetic protein FliO [Brucella gallinifaecis]TPF75828.1 hypothetical protein FHY56_07745 [Brucella gallinifaecis]